MRKHEVLAIIGKHRWYAFRKFMGLRDVGMYANKETNWPYEDVLEFYATQVLSPQVKRREEKFKKTKKYARMVQRHIDSLNVQIRRGHKQQIKRNIAREKREERDRAGRKELMKVKILRDFIKESNKIEGIVRSVKEKELNAYREFLDSSEITVEGLCGFVAAIQKGAVLRDKKGLDVYIGNYKPIEGGSEVVVRLQRIIDDLDNTHPYIVHCRYETLHPFTDGNGRSGRAIWYWQMNKRCGRVGYMAKLGFLHTFYYQALQNYGGRLYE